MRGLLWKSRTLGLPLLLPPSLQKGGSRDALVLLPEGLSLLLLDICPARGVEEPLVARSVHASSLLSPRFIRGLGVQELLSCGGLLLPALSRLVLPPHLCTPCEVMRREGLRRLALFSVASPSSSLHALRGDRRESLWRPAPVRVPSRLPNLRLGKPGRSFEPTLGRMALVTGLVAHAVAPLSIHG